MGRAIGRVTDPRWDRAPAKGAGRAQGLPSQGLGMYGVKVWASSLWTELSLKHLEETSFKWKEPCKTHGYGEMSP